MLGFLFPRADGLQAPILDRAIASGIPIRQPAWRISLAGRDVSRDISSAALSVAYTDHTHGESDDVELVLDNADGRWRNEWYPDEGTELELWIGYLGESLLPCGRFQIDELRESGPPDTLTVRALATGVKPSLRTRRSTSYESQTLSQIAAKIASRHGLTVTGLASDLRVDRITQDREDDLTFLTRLAEDYGYVFSVRGEQLVFQDLASLEAAPPVVSLIRLDVARHQLTSRTQGIYRAAEVRYHDAAKKEVITHTVDAPGVITGDTLKLYARVENQQQAEEMARAELRRRNARAIDGSISVEGDPSIVAGVNGTVVDFGRFGGKVHVYKSEHRLTRDAGYETTAYVRTVPA